MSSWTKASIWSYQPHALLCSPCKKADTAGFILALPNSNANKHSADAQRARILVTWWFGRTILVIHHLETCHVWPWSHKPGAEHTSTHPSLWERLWHKYCTALLKTIIFKTLFFSFLFVGPRKNSTIIEYLWKRKAKASTTWTFRQPQLLDRRV